MNKTSMSRLLAATLAAVLLPATPAIASTAVPLVPVGPACLMPDGEKSFAFYQVPEEAKGSDKDKAKVTTTFAPRIASCEGATYTFTVTGIGAPLELEDVVVDGGAVTGGTATPEVATFTLLGDGTAQEFALSGLTSKSYNRAASCIGLSVTATDPTGTVSYTWPRDPAKRQKCLGGGGAGNFYG